MITLTLYTKPDCPLCDTLKADLLAIQPKVGFVLVEQDIDALLQTNKTEKPDARLLDSYAEIARYRSLIPVLDIENGAVLYAPFSYDDLFDAIDRAVEIANTASTLIPSSGRDENQGIM